MRKLLTVAMLVAGAGNALAQGEASPPTNLTQFASDGVTIVPEGGTATSTTIIISGQLEGDGTRTVRLKIELRQTNQSFTGFFTHASPFGNVGETATITITGLTPGQEYHWVALCEAD